MNPAKVWPICSGMYAGIITFIVRQDSYSPQLNGKKYIQYLGYSTLFKSLAKAFVKLTKKVFHSI